MVKNYTHQFATGPVGRVIEKCVGVAPQCFICCALTLNVQSRAGLAHRRAKKLFRSVQKLVKYGHLAVSIRPFNELTSVSKADIVHQKNSVLRWGLLCLERRPSLSASYWPSGKPVTKNLCAA